jgi:hypothetical protein
MTKEVEEFFKVLDHSIEMCTCSSCEYPHYKIFVDSTTGECDSCYFRKIFERIMTLE